MNFDFAGGCRSDDAPVSAQPFVLYSENMRWRLGKPETIGLQSYARHLLDSTVITLPTAPFMAIFHDRRYIVFGGDAREVHFLDWETGVLTTVPTPSAAAAGAWWFVATEAHIIGARSSLTGRIYSFDRATLSATILPNSPIGGLAGGIVAGTLFVVGTRSFVPGPNAPAELTVRWSARRTDPSSNVDGLPTPGPFGFEDWTPSDVNASGEVLVERGTELIGGGVSSFGGLAFTDKVAYLFTPRTDVYTFTQREIAERGLLTNQVWCEADGRVWWFDQARTLNVFDGGSVIQVPNPLKLASVELMDPSALDSAFLTPNTGNGEIILCFRDIYGGQRQLVHNYRENVWYPWRLNRIGMEDRYGPRPAIGVTALGEVMFDDLPSALDEGYLRGEPAGEFVKQPTQGLNGIMPPAGSLVIEPFDCLLATSIVTTEGPRTKGVRTVNALLSHTHAALPGVEPSGMDYLHVRIDSYDEAARDAPIISSDEQRIAMGGGPADFRGGGRAVRAIISGQQISTFVRLGQLHLQAREGHHG